MVLMNKKNFYLNFFEKNLFYFKKNNVFIVCYIFCKKKQQYMLKNFFLKKLSFNKYLMKFENYYNCDNFLKYMYSNYNIFCMNYIVVNIKYLLNMNFFLKKFMFNNLYYYNIILLALDETNKMMLNLVLNNIYCILVCITKMFK